MLTEELSNQFDSELSFRDFLIKTFQMVAIGLAVTTTIAFITSRYIYYIYMTIGYYGYLALLLGEFAIAIYLSSRILKMSKGMAYFFFFLYAVLNGINMSFIFIVYANSSVVFAFAMTTILFISMAVIGQTTKLDLTKYSTLFAVGLGVLLIAGIVNIILQSEMLDWILCAAGVVLFLGIIAYDMQKLRHMYNQAYTDSSIADNLMIFGALQLYLDFINLFLRILRMFGRRKN